MPEMKSKRGQVTEKKIKTQVTETKGSALCEGNAGKNTEKNKKRGKGGMTVGTRVTVCKGEKK